ncbi:hypothetical protein BN2475_120015 [Paraburkholderia ribeironis]|uniref:Uncharacterized protein n=1 Tax=Paraburkholderia ribeironis TaxID=1247936 RepID=A0A1N7RQP5_9BURK|nr:hypothetical protein BN2475_120015 [Paraburkholderia ribeironis]
MPVDPFAGSSVSAVELASYAARILPPFFGVSAKAFDAPASIPPAPVARMPPAANTRIMSRRLKPPGLFSSLTVPAPSSKVEHVQFFAGMAGLRRCVASCTSRPPNSSRPGESDAHIKQEGRGLNAFKHRQINQNADKAADTDGASRFGGDLQHKLLRLGASGPHARAVRQPGAYGTEGCTT